MGKFRLWSIDVVLHADSGNSGIVDLFFCNNRQRFSPLMGWKVFLCSIDRDNINSRRCPSPDLSIFLNQIDVEGENTAFNS
jgi:hypothetical protein